MSEKSDNYSGEIHSEVEEGSYQWAIKNARNPEEIYRAFQELKKLTRVDSLTGLPNRPAFEERFKDFVARNDRKDEPFSVIIFDLNNFKRINDQYGHPAGDMALKKFSDFLWKNIRDTDYPCRWGGDEFMLLVSSDNAGVQTLLDRMNNGESQEDLVCRLEGGEEFSLSFSTGTASYREGATLGELTKEADVKMYESKKARELNE